MQTIIESYFPDLTDTQKQQLEALAPLYREWNEKINVISRKDIDNLYERHVLHSLAIAKVIRFTPGSSVLDLGTGGGFPGIPLAILFPKVRFMLIDGTGKKIQVVKAITEALALENVRSRQLRAEEMKERFDFVVSRAVARIDKLYHWSAPLLKNKEQNAIPNGLLCLKGGDVKGELAELPGGSYTEVSPISHFFEGAFFEEKYVVYVQR